MTFFFFYFVYLFKIFIFKTNSMIFVFFVGSFYRCHATQTSGLCQFHAERADDAGPRRNRPDRLPPDPPRLPRAAQRHRAQHPLMAAAPRPLLPPLPDRPQPGALRRR